MFVEEVFPSGKSLLCFLFERMRGDGNVSTESFALAFMVVCDCISVLHECTANTKTDTTPPTTRGCYFIVDATERKK